VSFGHFNHNAYTLKNNECFRSFVAIKAKNRAHLTEEEKRMVKRITVLCVAKLHSFLTTHKDPKKYASYLLKSSHSRKEYFLADFTLRAVGMPLEGLFTPQELNRKSTDRIRRVILDLETKSPVYCKPWEVTKALHELESQHLLRGNLRGKKVFKKLAPEMLRLKKGAGYYDDGSRKREGFYSGYKVTENLASLNKVVANPKALEKIHEGLLEYGVLEKFYVFMGKAFLHAMKAGDQSLFRYVTVGAQAILDGSPEIQAQLRAKGLDSKHIEYKYLKIIRQQLISLSEDEADKQIKAMIKMYIEKPIDPSYTLLSLSELVTQKQG
jgi:hypothetical protein